MPELPQMQALAERCDEALAGATLRAIQPLQFTALKTVTPAPDSLIGLDLRSVGRRGKYLVFTFEGARILVHLSQGGRVDLERPAKRTAGKQAVLRMVFSDAPAFFVKEFGTERKAAWWVLAGDDRGPLERLGPEPDDPGWAGYVRTSDDNRRVHTILRDQKSVAGIGRGYADDALHRARMSPYASLRSLDPDERERLLDAIGSVLGAALEAERRRAGGLPPKLSDNFTVHGRYGTPCPVCGEDLRRVSYESHEVTYCPRCQTDGTILADRRMSRLIK